MIAPIMTAVQSILQAAVSTNNPQPNVLVGIPRTFTDPEVIYFYHDGSSDIGKAGPNVIRRTHIIPIHLLLLTTADDAQTEMNLWTLTDLIVGAFYSNHRLNNTVATAELYQRDGKVNGASPAYVDVAGREFRQRWFTLEAIEQQTYSFS